MPRTAIIILVIFLSFVLLPLQANAENPSPGDEVGAQAERFKAQSQREREQLQKAKSLKVEIEKKKALVPHKPAFILKGVEVIGNTILRPEDFRPVYEPYLSKQVTFDDLDVIVEKINKKYEQKGYLTTNVFIPEQEIKDGMVEIKIVEGGMGELTIEGNKWFPASLIKKYFHIKKKEPLNVQKLQGDILRLNKNPDLEAKAVISAGKEPGASDITLKIKDHFPWHFGVGEDNLGTRLTGKYRTSFTVRGINVTGNGDKLFSSTILSKSSFGQFVGYSIPVDTFGTEVGMDMTYFRMKLGKEFEPFDITGETQMYTPYLVKELYLSDDLETTVKVGLDIKSIKKKIDGDITANDQLRIPYFEFNFISNDNFGQTVFTPRFNFSTQNFLGASSRNHPTSSREGTGGFFFKYEQFLSRTQQMFFDSYCILRSGFQWATHTLPSSEQFQLGGMNSVRGYPEGDYLADIGGNLNFDWVFPLYLIPASWKFPHSEVPLQRQIQPVFFVDMGGGRNRKALSGERKDKFLMGIGGGLRIRFNNNFNLRLEWAKHVGDKPQSGSGPSTFYFTFQGEI
ncbi:MAG: BamA/TamA family outer membrane protein [Candidatus Omnitrophica bacterium]|nr:BamA/TamA family outer membrane protein [Candidatus Omnitrophota bacterium]